MRKILANIDAVLHYWANQVQFEGECGNVSFRDGRLYSYAAQIAEIIQHDGQTYAVHTARKWSITTTSHQHSARMASSQHREVRIYDFYDERSLLDVTRMEILATSGKLERARKEDSKNWHRRHLMETIDGYNKYAEIKGWTSRVTSDVEDLRARVEAEMAEEKRLRKEREERERIERADAIEKWRRGEFAYVGSIRPVMLRVAGDVIETSMGAEIPVAHAKRLWPTIKEVEDKGEPLYLDRPLGVYRLSKIRGDGSIVVGCHDIPFNEIEMIAQQLGLPTSCVTSVDEVV